MRPKPVQRPHPPLLSGLRSAAGSAPAPRASSTSGTPAAGPPRRLQQQLDTMAGLRATDGRRRFGSSSAPTLQRPTDAVGSGGHGLDGVRGDLAYRGRSRGRATHRRHKLLGRDAIHPGLGGCAGPAGPAARAPPKNSRPTFRKRVCCEGCSIRRDQPVADDREHRHGPSRGAARSCVKVAACGVCHTDLHVLKSEVKFPVPAVLGHEVSGVVEQTGEGVDNVAVGDRVVCSFIMPCGDLPALRRGKEDLCEKFFALQQTERHPLRRRNAAGP